MAAYLTGNTNAYFTDASKVSGQISAGIWLPSLKVTEAGYSEDGKGIYAKVENAGAAMESTGIYQVLKENESVLEGSFDLLNEGGSTTLQFEASESGSYQFRISASGVEDVLTEILEITIEEQVEVDKTEEVFDEKSEDPPAEEVEHVEESTEDTEQPEPPANKEDPKQETPIPPADSGSEGDGIEVVPPAEETKEQETKQPSEPVQPPVEEPPSEQNPEKTIEQAGD
ncbi:SipW-dependent-type signal peptide-containing protein [Cytobacillus gottheilii]|uniref:SipW-dependent-type signal peptide-containing protein n=1 Tax=Cytobacillus gottheilii TaxID=859144 RepID=UPI001C58C321|nr:SipW-dependent-type signal peptide-containing protein [Cytobacillus gottheilii]